MIRKETVNETITF